MLQTKLTLILISDNNRKRRELSAVFNDQNNELDKNKLRNLSSIKFTRNPTSDKELPNKKIIDEKMGNGTPVSFNQTLEKIQKLVLETVFIILHNETERKL